MKGAGERDGGKDTERENKSDVLLTFSHRTQEIPTVPKPFRAPSYCIFTEVQERTLNER